MNKRTVGTNKEKFAAAYLQKQGVRITEHSFRVRQGEIDLIGYDGEVLVFFEVKYRKNAAYGFPQEAVDRRKQSQISKVAVFYLNYRKIPRNTPMRFDVVAILGREVTWIRNAFEMRM
ncbi:MAG: YraN family protein [Lachnospiraceae bacterium]|nr:YraN family protein [Lachnospiraceae bacterium]